MRSLLLLVALGCGCGSSDAGEGDATTSRPVSGLSPRAVVIGGGLVSLVSGSPLSSAPGAETHAAALFFFDPAGPGGTCSDRTLDGCTLSRCTGLDLTKQPRTVSAGDVTFTGAAGGPVTATFNADGRYAGGAGTWAPDQRITIAAAGAAVPAFQSEASVPPPLKVEEPQFESSFDFTVNRAVPLDARWSGGGDAEVEVVIMQPAIGREPVTTNVVCAFPAAAGRGSISARVLQTLSRTTTAQVTIAAVRRRTEHAGNFEVRVEGVSFPFFGRATFR